MDFQQDLSLPGPTMFINDSSLEVTASSFDNVGAKQSALLVLQNSTLVMSDTIFSNNVGSIAGAQLLSMSHWMQFIGSERSQVEMQAQRFSQEQRE